MNNFDDSRVDSARMPQSDGPGGHRLAGRISMRRRSFIAGMGGVALQTGLGAGPASAASATLSATVNGQSAQLTLRSRVLVAADIGRPFTLGMALPQVTPARSAVSLAWVDARGRSTAIAMTSAQCTIRSGEVALRGVVTRAMVGGRLSGSLRGVVARRTTATGSATISTGIERGTCIVTPQSLPPGNQITSGVISVLFDGRIHIRRNGVELETINGLYLSDLARTLTGTSRVVDQQLIVTHAAPAGFANVVATYTISGSAVHADFSFTAPANFWAEGPMVLRSIAGQSTRTTVPVNDWVQDPKGGLPVYVQRFMAYRSETLGNGAVWECVANNNRDWVNDEGFNSPAIRQKDNSWRVGYTFVAVDSGVDTLPLAAGPRLQITTDAPFNWIPRPGAMTLSFAAAGAVGAGSVAWTLHSYDGAQLAAGTRVTAGAARAGVPVSLPANGSYYVVAKWSGAGGATALCRTVLAVAPAVTQGTRSFGIAALDPALGAADGLRRTSWFTLMNSMGATRLRQPDEITPAEAQQGKLICNQNVVISDVNSTAGQDSLFAGWVARAKAFSSPYIELGNELNTLNPDDATGAAAYTRNWILPFRRYLDAHGCTSKLMVNGLAGPNVGWLKGIAAAGGWSAIDAIALHPARGNYTADYVPGDDPHFQGGDYWNFLGALRTVRAQRDALDRKYGTRTDFLLTEAYACTYPNSWWEDTMRHSAENVLLTCALAKAEKVDALYWYQPHDGLNGGQQTAMQLGMPDSQAREFHFGFLNGDHSIKPSLLAFATASRALADATFVKWEVAGNVKSLVFSTPQGRLDIVWDRTDGYVLNRAHASQMYVDSMGRSRWNEPEWWVDQWPTKTRRSLPAATSQVEVISCVGARRTVATAGGRVELTLDGAPVIVRGISGLS